MLSHLDPGIASEPPSNFHAKVFDGAAIVHNLPTKQAATFDEYRDKVFLSWTKQQLQSSERIDIVWDTYVTNSLKESTREKRSEKKSEGPDKVNFPDFLRDPKNKTELFELLTEKLATYDYPGKTVYITSGIGIINYRKVCKELFSIL